MDFKNMFNDELLNLEDKFEGKMQLDSPPIDFEEMKGTFPNNFLESCLKTSKDVLSGSDMSLKQMPYEGSQVQDENSTNASLYSSTYNDDYGQPLQYSNIDYSDRSPQRTFTNSLASTNTYSNESCYNNYSGNDNGFSSNYLANESLSSSVSNNYLASESLNSGMSNNYVTNDSLSNGMSNNYVTNDSLSSGMSNNYVTNDSLSSGMSNKYLANDSLNSTFELNSNQSTSTGYESSCHGFNLDSNSNNGDLNDQDISENEYDQNDIDELQEGRLSLKKLTSAQKRNRQKQQNKKASSEYRKKNKNEAKERETSCKELEKENERLKEKEKSLSRCRESYIKAFDVLKNTLPPQVYAKMMQQFAAKKGCADLATDTILKIFSPKNQSQ